MQYWVANLIAVAAFLIIMPFFAWRISVANRAHFRGAVRQLHKHCIYLCVAKGWNSPHRLSRSSGCKLSTARLVLEHFRDIGVLELRFDGRYHLTAYGAQFTKFLITQQYDPAKKIEHQARLK